MKKSVKNIVANFISKIWGFIALYLFSRIYVNILGIELYGVISFYTLILAIVSFADAGLSSSLTREFAREGTDNYLAGLLRFFEKIYIVICISAGLIISLFARQISEKWLSSNTLPDEMLVNFIRLIGIGVSAQLISTIYFGALMGRQLQVWANGAQIILSVVKTFGGVSVLLLSNKSLYVFFIWQLICNIFYMYVLRSRIFSNLKADAGTGSLTMNEIPKALWKYMGAMTLVAILSSLTIQSDKLVTSKFFSLTDFGFYSLASMLAQLPVLIVIPIVLAIFPLLIKNYSLGQTTNFYKIYQDVSFAISILVFPISAILSFYGTDIFTFWLSSKNMTNVPNQIDVVILLLVLGNMFQALQCMPFYLLLAKGKTKFTIWQVSFELLFIIPSLYFFIKKYNLGGIGAPWLIVKSIGYFYLLYIVERIKPKELKINYKRIILIPALTTFAIAFFFFLIFKTRPEPGYALLCSFLIGAVSISANIFFYDRAFFNILNIRQLFKL